MKTDKQYEHSARSFTIAFVGIVVMIVIALLTGCGSTKTVTEKIVKEADSTAIISLQTELSVKNKIIENLQTDLKHTREENSRLRSESSSHTINYDREGQVDPGTGKKPILSETFTRTKSEYDKVVKESEAASKRYVATIDSISRENLRLTDSTKALRSSLETVKSERKTGFNIRSFFAGFGASLIFTLLMAAYFYFRH